jgi:serine/threonine protein phosphatase PrpC
MHICMYIRMYVYEHSSAHACCCCCVQDAWVIQERLAGQDMLMFGVFDGHGQEGKTVSHSICTNLPKALSKHAACKVRMPPSRVAPVGFRAPGTLSVVP